MPKADEILTGTSFIVITFNYTVNVPNSCTHVMTLDRHSNSLHAPGNETLIYI